MTCISVFYNRDVSFERFDRTENPNNRLMETGEQCCRMIIVERLCKTMIYRINVKKNKIQKQKPVDLKDTKNCIRNNYWKVSGKHVFVLEYVILNTFRNNQPYYFNGYFAVAYANKRRLIVASTGRPFGCSSRVSNALRYEVRQ